MNNLRPGRVSISRYRNRTYVSNLNFPTGTIFIVGGHFIKRDRKGLLFSTNSHVKSIAGRVLAVLGVFSPRRGPLVQGVQEDA